MACFISLIGDRSYWLLLMVDAKESIKKEKEEKSCLKRMKE
jgi:hypothetical protein